MAEFVCPQSWTEFKDLITHYGINTNIEGRYEYERKFYHQYFTMTKEKERVNYILGLFGDSDIYFQPNAFPYSMMLSQIPTVVHCILWMKKRQDDDTITQIIQKIVAPYEFIWFENTRDHQSIPELSHVQIFVNCENLQNVTTFKNLF